MTGLLAASFKALDISNEVLKKMELTRSKLEDLITRSESGSLTKQVAGSISVFPVIITNDIPVNPATQIAQMLELEYANYMTLALAGSPRVHISDINDSKYLAKYHTNLSKLESVLEESFDSDNEIESALARVLMDNVMEDIKIDRVVAHKLTNMMNETLNPKPKIYGLDWLMEDRSSRDDIADERWEREHWLKREKMKNDDEYRRERDKASDEYRKERDEKADERAARQDERQDRQEARQARNDTFSRAGSIISAAKTGYDIYRDQRDTKYRRQQDEESRIDSHTTKDFSKTFSYKKINEMQPTPVLARIFTVDDNNTPSRAIEVVSGVKAHLHPITKSELFSVMNSDNRGNLLAQIIRFTTGEINFFTDILLNIGSIRTYAEKMSKFHSNGAKVLAILKRVKDVNRGGSKLKPNATLVLSKSAVEEIKRKVGIDLLDEDEALDLCDQLSLIKFMVLDPLGGKLHVLLPGLHDTFSVMSTDTLVDATMDASLTKELRKVISKG